MRRSSRRLTALLTMFSSLAWACGGGGDPAAPADGRGPAAGGATDAAADRAPDGPEVAADAGLDAIGDGATGPDAADAAPDTAADAPLDAPADAPADAPVDGATQPPLWDLASIRDPSTASCAFTNPHTAFEGGVLLDVWSVSYTSWESIAGQLHPITIRGFYARPALLSAAQPGIVLAHGLGGYAKESSATGLAALVGAAVLAYTGPGGGTGPDDTSEGLAAMHDNGYRLFDTLADVRGSWFWAHTVAALRGLTCLETRGDVDASRLGMTGFSAGSVATLLASGADDRIVAAVPLSGTGAWSIATQSPDAWQHALLAQAGLDTTSPEWTKLQSLLIDPAVMVGGAKAHVLMADGSSDEFFPLTAFAATYDAIPTADKRTSVAANFDHGCYSVSGVESAQTIEDRAKLHADGCQRAWFRHWFGTDAALGYFPATPKLATTTAGAATAVVATVDEGGSDLEVAEVKVWASGDDAWLFAGASLDHTASGIWSKIVPVPFGPGTISYVDVTYRKKNLLAPDEFAISSEPSIPAGLVPHIRKYATCL